MPLENYYTMYRYMYIYILYYHIHRCSSQTSKRQYHCRPKTASWFFSSLLARFFDSFRPLTKKHPIPTPLIRGGNEGNTFQSLSLSESIRVWEFLLIQRNCCCHDYSDLASNLTNIRIYLNHGYLCEKAEGLQCLNDPKWTLLNNISQNTCFWVLFPDFPECNVQGWDARDAKLQESRKVGNLHLNISKSCTQHVCQGPGMLSCAIILRLASYLLRDLEVRKAFVHLQYPTNPWQSMNGCSGFFCFLIILININHHMIKRCVYNIMPHVLSWNKSE